MPFQWAVAPSYPTSHMLLVPLPQMPDHDEVDAASVVDSVQPASVKCTSVSALPVVQASPAPEAQTASKLTMAPVTSVHVVPVQWKIAPLSPTAQTSLGPLPQTQSSRKYEPTPKPVQVEPFHW